MIFVGADALRAWPAIQPVLEAAESIKSQGKRTLTFILDLAPEQATPEILAELKKHDVALRVRVRSGETSSQLDPALQSLISQVEGRLAVRVDSGSSVEAMAATVRALCQAGAKLVYLEGCPSADQVQALYTHLEEDDDGSQPIFRLADLTSLMAACHLGDYRLYGCQAGWGMVAVSPDGDLFPCHQFVGIEAFKLGTIETGIEPDRQAPFCACPVDARPICQACWARYFCGGGCAFENWQHQGDLQTPAKAYCALTQERLRWAFERYSQLGRERKNTLDISLAVATHHKPYLAFTRSSPAPNAGGKV
jgi:radical SAM protein with 4Fe4S-binding SPASM domain